MKDKVLNNEIQGGGYATSYGGYAGFAFDHTKWFDSCAAINSFWKSEYHQFLGWQSQNRQELMQLQDKCVSGSNRRLALDEPLTYIATSAVSYMPIRIKNSSLILTGWRGNWGNDAWYKFPESSIMRCAELGKEVLWVNYRQRGHGAARAVMKTNFTNQWNSESFDFTRKQFKKPALKRRNKLEPAKWWSNKLRERDWRLENGE